MYPFAKAVVNMSGRAVQQVRHGSGVRKDFHSKYGNVVLAGGALCFASVWTYLFTQIGLNLNPSPIGRLTPKEWREE